MEPKEPKHCDDYIDDPGTPVALRAFLARAREPAHGMLRADRYPRLFATYAGKRVRVTMASQLGDVGISYDWSRDFGYDTRVAVESLTDFSETQDRQARQRRSLPDRAVLVDRRNRHASRGRGDRDDDELEALRPRQRPRRLAKRRKQALQR